MSDRFDEDGATKVAYGLAEIIREAARAFGGYTMLGGMMKFNIDFAVTGIAMGRMPVELMKTLSECHRSIADKLDAEIERKEKDVN